MAKNCTIGMINPSKNTCRACGYRCTEKGFQAFISRDTHRNSYKIHAQNGRKTKKG